MNVPGVLDYLPLERFVMSALIIPFCSVQVSLVLHNETLRAAFRAHREFIRTNLFRFGWFLLICGDALFLSDQRAMPLSAARSRIAWSGVIAWKIIYVCVRGLITGWLLASWVCLFRQCETGARTRKPGFNSEIRYIGASERSEDHARKQIEPGPGLCCARPRTPATTSRSSMPFAG